jgi:hypothetical protein
MPIDTNSAYADLMSRTDELLTKTASRIASSKEAAALEGLSKTAERLAILDGAVAETSIEAAVALTKLAEVRQNKVAARAEKVAIVRHMARVANSLLEN